MTKIEWTNQNLAKAFRTVYENEDDEDTKKVMKFLMEGVEEIDDDAMYQESLSLTIAAKWNLSEEDPENALKLINEAIKTNDKRVKQYNSFDDPEFLYTKADILLDLDKPKQALVCINECKKLELKNYKEERILQLPSVEHLKGEIYHDLGKYTLAIKCFLQVTKLFKSQKIRKDDRALTLGETYYQLGHNYAHIRKWKESLKSLKKAKLHTRGENLAFSYLEEAYVLVELKKYKDALVAAKKATKLDKEIGEYWMMFAYCLVLNKKDPMKILECLIRAHTLGQSDQDEKDWKTEISTIRHYLKTIDEDKLTSGVLKLKDRFVKRTSNKNSKK